VIFQSVLKRWRDEIARFNSENSDIVGRKYTKFGCDVARVLPLKLLKADLRSAYPLSNAEAKSKGRSTRRRRYRHERPSASAVDNGLADRKSAFKGLNGSIRATLYPNLVNFSPIIWEFMLLKRATYAAICRNLTTIFNRHVDVSNWIGRSQFWFQHSNRQSFLYTL